jgi:hypothetical protein
LCRRVLAGGISAASGADQQNPFVLQADAR